MRSTDLKHTARLTNHNEQQFQWSYSVIWGGVGMLNTVFTAHCFASAVLPTAIPSVRPSVTRRYCVKTTARSMVKFTLSDSKMCLVLQKSKNINQGRPLPPEIFARTDLPPPDSSESWHLLPCSASTVRDRKRRSITLNKNSTWAFQRGINQGSAPPLTSSKWG